MQQEKAIKTISKGKCMICGEVLAKNIMTRHLASHRKEDIVTKASSGYFHVLVEGRYNPESWLHVELPTKAPLEDLDCLLRDIWLECCGHLSAFTINGEQFTSNPDNEYGDQRMSTAFEKILTLGMKFIYEYDFGTTTDLLGKVVGAYQDKTKRPVTILARNDQPDLRCMICAEKAERICSECT